MRVGAGIEWPSVLQILNEVIYGTLIEIKGGGKVVNVVTASPPGMLITMKKYCGALNPSPPRSLSVAVHWTHPHLGPPLEGEEV